MRLDKLSMQFAMHDTGFIGDVLEAYERLILDAMRGDRTLFTTAEGIERLWQVSTGLLESRRRFAYYGPGSWGPNAIHQLVAPSCLATALRTGVGGIQTSWEADVSMIGPATLSLGRTANRNRAAPASRRLRAMHCRGRDDQFFAAHVLALFPCRISAKGRIEFEDAIVVLNRPQFVFFAQFDRHQPCAPSKLGAMSADVRGEFRDIGATVVLLNKLGAVRLISAESAHIRGFSGVEITPLNVLGKGEGRATLCRPSGHALVQGRLSCRHG